MGEQTGGTESRSYTDRLVRLQRGGWKRALDVQRPYRAKLRRVLGDRVTLDVGCGIGRTLVALPAGSVGVDHNLHSVRRCRELGLTAYLPEELPPPATARFDGMLVAHLLEHLPPGDAATLLSGYLPWLRPGGRVVLICPQERGFASDDTHTQFLDHEALRAIATEAGLQVDSQESFPFPRWAGRLFTYNEFVTTAGYPG